MKNLLKTQQGVAKLTTLYDIAWELQERDDSLGINYGVALLKLGKELKNYPSQANAYNVLGRIAKYQKRYEEAERYFLQAVEISELHDFAHGVARGYNELGMFYEERKQDYRAIEIYFKSYTFFLAHGNKTAAAKVAANLGGLLRKIGEYAEALKYYIKSLELRTALQDTFELAKINRSLAELSKDLKNYEEMLAYNIKAKQFFQQLKEYNDVFEMNIQIAVSYTYLLENEKAKATYLETKKMIPLYDIKDASNLYHNFATLYKKTKVLDSALYYYQKAQKIFKSTKDSVRLSKNYNNLGNLYMLLGDNQKALANYNQSLALKHKLKDESSLEKTYHALSEYYKRTNNFKKAIAYKDSSERIREKLAAKIKKSDRVALNYIREKQQVEAKKSKAEIATVNANLEVAKERRNTIIIAIILLAVSILFFVFLRVKKLKQQKKLAELTIEQQKIKAQLDKEQHEKKLEEMLKEQERKAITTMISGQEEERERIAKDLHDRLGSMLSVVKIHYKSVEEDLEKIKKETKSQYEKANALLDEACETVRKIAHNMISGTLTKFGLVPALKELKQKIEETKMLQIELLAHGLDNRLDNTTEIQLYRIIQELLNNVLKHANATEVTIQVLKREVDLNIMVSDNGVGFDINKSQFEGMGLKSIKARVVEMNGQVLIDSGTGNGTTITIEIPTTK
ncbi:MAG: tetratricopeptide repeat protein [Bacteroidota bacterium]